MPDFSHIEEIIADAKNGKMFILVDDENRENEGDLVIPANFADADAVNFMAKYGRGLICLALTEERVSELKIPLMPRSNSSRFDTAFTVSIEAREGISTGISAADRARTIAVAIDTELGAESITTPGHVFPLVSRNGGVLVRAGHTEAAVDVARMAGVYPAGVICEIMKDDGTMARLPDLLEFAKSHSLKIASIADLIDYRLKSDRLVGRISERQAECEGLGACKMVIYESSINNIEHIALVKGDINNLPCPVPVRMHAINIIADILKDREYGRSSDLLKAFQMIERIGYGVIVLLRDPAKNSISRIYAEDASVKNLRDYGIGAQILRDLGVKNMELLSNHPRQIVGLEGYGLHISGFKPLD
jgi:3,4-dihydroxy 2-butanone 4-phosphate synthase/GTP cyclohydrolase II